MLEDAKNGLFDVIIAKDLSRIARNQMLTLSVKELVTKHEIKLIDLNGMIDINDLDKEDTFGLYAWFYERESRNTSQRIKNTFILKMKKANFLVQYHHMDIKKVVLITNNFSFVMMKCLTQSE